MKRKTNDESFTKSTHHCSWSSPDWDLPLPLLGATMIYGLIGIGIGILLAAIWEVLYFHKNIKENDK